MMDIERLTRNTWNTWAKMSKTSRQRKRHQEISSQTWGLQLRPQLIRLLIIHNLPRIPRSCISQASCLMLRWTPSQTHQHRHLPIKHIISWPVGSSVSLERPHRSMILRKMESFQAPWGVELLIFKLIPLREKPSKIRDGMSCSNQVWPTRKTL
jgi:hypothetical protein